MGSTGVVQAEAAWRARHKWGAQRLAHLLSDAHERPPLGPAFDLLETLSLNIGLAIDGMAVGSFATPALATGSPALESATSGLGWAPPGPGTRFNIVGSLRTHTPDPSAPVETSGRAVSISPSCCCAVLNLHLQRQRQTQCKVVLQRVKEC